MKKIIPIIILVIVAGTIACTKFKDDPFISLRSPQHRLLGNWTLVAFEVDGVDSTNHYINQYSVSCAGISFYKNETYDYALCGNSDAGYFSVVKKQLSLQSKDLFFLNKTNANVRYGEHDIIKLYKNDLWLQREENNKTYILKYKKQ